MKEIYKLLFLVLALVKVWLTEFEMAVETLSILIWLVFPQFFVFFQTSY